MGKILGVVPLSGPVYEVKYSQSLVTQINVISCRKDGGTH